MTEFVFANWFFCLATSVFLLMVWLRYRYLLVKPSIIVIILFHLSIQWAATLQANDIETYLPDPWIFFLLAQGFPLVGLVVSFFIGSSSARAIWQRLSSSKPVSRTSRRRVLSILGTGVILSSLVYLTYVPLSSTGLYAILTDPLSSTLARENSLATLGNPTVQYLYSIMANGFAPLLAVLLSMLLLESIQKRQRVWSSIWIAGLIGVLFVVSITGARSYAATIILAILLAWFLRRKFQIKALYFILGAVVVLTFPTVFSILREGRELTLSNFWLYLTTAIFQRVFFIPMQMGLWHVHYAQTMGFVGIAGIPKLASLFGVEPINLANVVALLYYPWAIESSLANTSYVFSYYAYFGPFSLLLTLPALWFLDASLWIYKRLSDNMLLPCVAAVSVASISFVSIDYTIAWLTNGFGVLLLLAWILDRIGQLEITRIPVVRNDNAQLTLKRKEQ